MSSSCRARPVRSVVVLPFLTGAPLRDGLTYGTAVSDKPHEFLSHTSNVTINGKGPSSPSALPDEFSIIHVTVFARNTVHGVVGTAARTRTRAVAPLLEGIAEPGEPISEDPEATLRVFPWKFILLFVLCQIDHVKGLE